MKKLRNFKFKIDSSDSLDNIGRDVSAQVRGVLKNEMTEKIENTPKVTTVDYTKKNRTFDLEKAGLSSSGKDPYDIYGKVTDDGKISSVRTTPRREEKVMEIFSDGTSKLSSKEDFEKKVKNQSVSEEDTTELSRIVRVSSKDSDAYKTSDTRAAHALNAFDADKYKIEEAAARRGVPVSLLSSVYFKKIAETGSPLNAVTPRYAKLAYHRLYGQPLAWDDTTLTEYLQTPEGILDFIAIGLKSEAKFNEVDINLLSSKELSKVLAYFAHWNDDSPAFSDTVMAYSEIFEDIYKKLPSQYYEVKLV